MAVITSIISMTCTVVLFTMARRAIKRAERAEARLAKANRLALKAVERAEEAEAEAAVVVLQHSLGIDDFDTSVSGVILVREHVRRAREHLDAVADHCVAVDVAAYHIVDDVDDYDDDVWTTQD